jgi:O-antigen/teichoic acid export membrane protein
MAVSAYFAIKIVVGLALLKLSSAMLSVADFTIFTQFLLFSALLNMVAVGGSQTGLIRQVAASEDSLTIERAQGGAFAIWGGACAIFGAGSILLAVPISHLLVDDPGYGWAVQVVAVLSILSGPGQIYGALLSGRGRAALSLLAQALGLAVGGGGALWMLSRSDALGAVFAFTAGPIVTSFVGMVLARKMDLAVLGRFDDVRREVRRLVGYSGSFVTVASFSAFMFFVLRYLYRDIFGVEALSQWLVANRISDTTTQLLGLYMVQIFLPTYTRSRNSDKAAKILVTSWFVATAVMTSFLAAFAVAPELFVRTFLSQQYLPAIPGIMLYMLGDILRVSASLAMHTAFAEARLRRYIGIEVATVCLFAVLMASLTFSKFANAPFVAYPMAYGLASAVLLVIGLRRLASSSAALPDAKQA